jgi:hypothetical protein
MYDLKHRLDIYRLTYASWFLWGLIVLAFGFGWFGETGETTWRTTLFLGTCVVAFGLQTARLFKRQNERIERLEEALARLRRE